MFSPPYRLIGLVFLLILSGPVTADASQAPIRRIIAIGDLHGDYAAWRSIASAAHVIDHQGHWAGGDTVLVQTGDVVDRGPNSLGIIVDLMRLQHEATRAGGRVIALIGNHEAMNVTDDLRYVTAGDFAAFANRNSALLRDRTYTLNEASIEADYHARNPKMTNEAIRQAWMIATPLGFIEHQSAWHPDGRIGRWIVGNPAIVLLDGTLFVHGGISAAYASISIAEINRRVSAALEARETSPESIINDISGPLWYRGLVAIDGRPATVPAANTYALAQSPIDNELDTILRAYGAARIVIGHTPILTGIAILHGGRLIRIDTGISSVFGGSPSFLEIANGKIIPHRVARSQPTQTENR